MCKIKKKMSRNCFKRSNIPSFKVVLLSNLLTPVGTSTTLGFLSPTGQAPIPVTFSRRNIIRSITITPLFVQGTVPTHQNISLQINPTTFGQIPLVTNLDLGTINSPGSAQLVNYVPYSSYTITVTALTPNDLPQNNFQLTLILENIAAYKADLVPRLFSAKQINCLASVLRRENINEDENEDDNENENDKTLLLMQKRSCKENPEDSFE